MRRDVSSPNYGERRARLDMIVLHYTGMESAQAALDRLCDPAAQVSAHYLIDRDGSAFELVDPRKRAWHAGVSAWEGHGDVNSRSIGIELVNLGHEHGYQDFPEAQVTVLLRLLAKLCLQYRIPQHAVWGHSDVAAARKEDPGEKFPWARLARHGFGIWPLVSQRAKVPGHCDSVLSQIGYDVADLAAAQQAFKRHFRPPSLGQGWTQADQLVASAVLDRLKRVRLRRRA
ncbi:MAG: N-acetylmuramoyl-L-alanine amidase [Pseudomonadota bacterium]